MLTSTAEFAANRIRIALAAAAAIAIAATACTLSSRDSDTTVLLLGYGNGFPGGDVGSAEEYRTMALRFAPGGVTMIGRVPDILVPSASGFDRLGVTTLCERDSAAGHDDYHQVVWRSAAASIPVIKAKHPCTDAAASDSTATMVCGNSQAWILFAAPKLWAEEINAQETEECEPRGDRSDRTNIVHRAGRVDSVSLATVFDSLGAVDALDVAMQEGLDAMKNDGFNCPQPDEASLLNWDIRHRRGEWIPMATVKEYVIRGECQFSAPIHLHLPDSLIGDASHGELWTRLAAIIPDLEDYLVSPNGAWVVAFTGKSGQKVRITAYAMRGAAPLKVWEDSLGWRNNVVMAQWSGRGEAARWSSFIKQEESRPARTADR